MFSALSTGKSYREHGRNDCEILGDVVGDGKRGECAPRHQQLLADFYDFNQLGGIGVEIDHVSGFFGGLRAGIHGDADVGLRQRGGVVGAVAGHGDEFAAGLLAANELQFVFGCGLRKKVVDACLARNGRGGQRIVAGDHHGANAHGAQLREAISDASLDYVFQMNDAHGAPILGHD